LPEQYPGECHRAGFHQNQIQPGDLGQRPTTRCDVRNTPAGRFADVSEIMGIALYLASSASSFTTGKSSSWTAD